MRCALLSAVLSLSLLLSALVAAHAASYTFTTLAVPGGVSTFPFGINTHGQIVGNYYTGAYHGFLYGRSTFLMPFLPHVAASTIGAKSSGPIFHATSPKSWLSRDTWEVNTSPPVMTIVASLAALSPPNGKLILMAGTI